jgi:hypothetical protein
MMEVAKRSPQRKIFEGFFPQGVAKTCGESYYFSTPLG